MRVRRKGATYPQENARALDQGIGSAEASRCLCAVGDQGLSPNREYLLADAVAYNTLLSISIDHPRVSLGGYFGGALADHLGLRRGTLEHRPSRLRWQQLGIAT